MVTIMIHYEALRVTSRVFTHIHIAPRARILVVLAVTLLSHFLQVMLYAWAYYLMHYADGFGYVSGAEPFDMENAFYFSISSYTTLGIGDLIPNGGLRIISGAEALNGLVLVGWTASFTYLTMEKFWHLRPEKKAK
jgi:hypothetical protein